MHWTVLMEYFIVTVQPKRVLAFSHSFPLVRGSVFSPNRHYRATVHSYVSTRPLPNSDIDLHPSIIHNPYQYVRPLSHIHLTPTLVESSVSFYLEHSICSLPTHQQQVPALPLSRPDNHPTRLSAEPKRKWLL